MNSKGIGRRIRQLRKQRGFTQKQLANMLGISGATVSGYEIGDYGLSIETAVNIALLFNISLDWLLVGESRNTNSAPNEMPDDETELLSVYRNLDKTPQALILKLCKVIVRD